MSEVGSEEWWSEGGVILDHLTFLKNRAYRRVTLAKLRKLRSGLHGLTVLHENNDSCCRLEPWPVTMTTRIVQELNMDGHTTIGLIRT